MVASVTVFPALRREGSQSAHNTTEGTTPPVSEEKMDSLRKKISDLLQPSREEEHAHTQALADRFTRGFVSLVDPDRASRGASMSLSVMNRIVADLLKDPDNEEKRAIAIVGMAATAIKAAAERLAKPDPDEEQRKVEQQERETKDHNERALSEARRLAASIGVDSSRIRIEPGPDGRINRDELLRAVERARDDDSHV